MFHGFLIERRGKVSRNLRLKAARKEIKSEEIVVELEGGNSLLYYIYDIKLLNCEAG